MKPVFVFHYDGMLCRSLAFKHWRHPKYKCVTVGSSVEHEWRRLFQFLLRARKIISNHLWSWVPFCQKLQRQHRVFAVHSCDTSKLLFKIQCLFLQVQLFLPPFQFIIIHYWLCSNTTSKFMQVFFSLPYFYNINSIYCHLVSYLHEEWISKRMRENVLKM